MFWKARDSDEYKGPYRVVDIRPTKTASPPDLEVPVICLHSHSPSGTGGHPV
jgi:hypothetical protein